MQISVEVKDYATPKLNYIIRKFGSKELSRVIKKPALTFFRDTVYRTSGGALGQQWKPRKKPTGNWSLLQKTGRMRKSTKARQIHNGVRVETGAKYATFHQTGTKKMIVRPLYKENDKAKYKLTKLVEKQIQKWMR